MPTGSHQVAAFTGPVDGTVNAAADVLTNDEALRTGGNAHDADATIHLQTSTLAGRPAFGSPPRVWFTTDTLQLWYDSGSAWVEVPYLELTGGTLTGGLTVNSGGVTVQAGGLTVNGGGLNVPGQAIQTGTFNFSSSITTSSGAIQLGPSPAGGGAIRIDGSAYATVVFRSQNATSILTLNNGTGSNSIGSASAHPLDLLTSNTARWRLDATVGHFTPAADAAVDLGASGARVRNAFIAGTLRLDSTTTTTAPGAGGAGALPATPTGYVAVNIGGTSRLMPYY